LPWFTVVVASGETTMEDVHSHPGIRRNLAQTRNNMVNGGRMGSLVLHISVYNAILVARCTRCLLTEFSRCGHHFAQRHCRTAHLRRCWFVGRRAFGFVTVVAVGERGSGGAFVVRWGFSIPSACLLLLLFSLAAAVTFL